MCLSVTALAALYLVLFFRRVIEEILHTEEAYVADLKLVVEVWL